MDGTPNRQDEATLRECSKRYFPEGNGPVLSMKSCMFTNSPDEHFIIDLLPRNPRVAIAAGFSGHGFKLCSLVGEVLADLAIKGRTRHDLSLFRFGRLTQ